MMTMLVEREDSQYSYQNTLVAMDAEQVVGISVSYDGGCLRELRRAFIEAAKEQIGKDHSGMDDETQAGELYLDSLAVLPDYRRQGIARKLLLATKERANRQDLPCVGLLVDKDNPVGEALYTSVGFQYVNDNQWGGHPMKHLILQIMAYMNRFSQSDEGRRDELIRIIEHSVEKLTLAELEALYYDMTTKSYIND